MSSGVGVVDKTMLILNTLEHRPATLMELVEATGIARPTVHRLAAALIHHGVLARDERSRYILGPRITSLAAVASQERIAYLAQGVLGWLRDTTGESAQVFRRAEHERVCIATAERPIGLRDTIPVGSRLAMSAGSAAQVLVAWDEHAHDASFPPSLLAGVRRRGWAQSVGEREDGVASVSAPVRSRAGHVVAAISISGPVERLSRNPGRHHSATVVTAAHRLSDLLRADQK